MTGALAILELLTTMWLAFIVYILILILSWLKRLVILISSTIEVTEEEKVN
jgi:hypothetical protein